MAIDLRQLFTDPDMFDSRDDWRDAGFDVFDRSGDNKIMVASHASAPGVLFKKYVNDVDLDKQHTNYRRRVEGADRVRSFVADRRLSRVTAPRKWLHELPRSFGSRHEPGYVLVVERLPLLDSAPLRRAYEDIDEDQLAQLCAVLLEFRGLDSAIMNVPFLEDGRIAFIDTEHWDRRSRSKKFLDHIRSYLTKDRYKRAKKIYERDHDDDDDYEEDD